MIGFQTQTALVAPARRKRARTRRHAATYSSARLPLTPIAHGRQSPFISAAKRSITGRRYAATCAAQRSIRASCLPATIVRSANAGWSRSSSIQESHGSHEISGTAPRSLIARALAAGKSGSWTQSAKRPTIAARAPTPIRSCPAPSGPGR